MTNLSSNGTPTIYTYTRAQAIEDKVLVDISTMAREAGFVFPVAMTHAAWVDCVQWTSQTSKRKPTLQDEDGRLWDVVWMASRACKVGGDGPSKRFTLYRVPVQGKGIKPQLTTLVLHVGPGDTVEPVITIMMPGED